MNQVSLWNCRFSSYKSEKLWLSKQINSNIKGDANLTSGQRYRQKFSVNGFCNREQRKNITTAMGLVVSRQLIKLIILINQPNLVTKSFEHLHWRFSKKQLALMKTDRESPFETLFRVAS